MNDITKTSALSDDDLQRAMQEREKLDAKIEAMRQERRDADLAKVKELSELHGFTATDLRGSLKIKSAVKTPRKSAGRPRKK